MVKSNMAKSNSDMTFKELREKVLDLENQWTKFRRLYEDAIYNIDTENLSAAVRKEKDDLQARLSVTADKIEAVAAETDRQSASLSLTADALNAVVAKKANLDKAEKVDALPQDANPDTVYAVQTKNEDGAVLSETYYYYNTLTKAWTVLSGSSLHTVFEQTAEGFNLKGNVRIDGNTVVTENLTLSGKVTWDMDNSPVKAEYSADGTAYHTDFNPETDCYMRLSFDGGKTWSTKTKIVGTDGADGTDAYVTPRLLFDTLTDGGENEGLFPAFYNGGEHLFINASYIQSGTIEAERINTENLGCTRLYAKNNLDGYSVRLNGAFGDFGIFNALASDTDSAKSTYCMFGIYNDVPNINFYVYGHNFMGYSVSDNTVWPKETWDFSAANLILPDTVSLPDTVTATAVFG